MNETLILAQRILQVLSESGLTYESQLAANKIVTKLLVGAPYGVLAQTIPERAESSEDANRFLRTDNTYQGRSSQSPDT